MYGTSLMFRKAALVLRLAFAAAACALNASLAEVLPVRPDTAAVCAGQGAADYSNTNNWLIADTRESDTAAIDVFYVYPTLVSDKDNPLMDFDDAEVSAKALDFACAQTGLFGANVRVFAPKIRQLEFLRCMKALTLGSDFRTEEGFCAGYSDTILAFRSYLENWNNGNPYILFGHSQGAMDLYELIRRGGCVSVSGGFVAAYLIGLPSVSADRIRSDMSASGILPASDESGAGVVVVWNTQSPNAGETVFSGKGTFVINPLNWRTDSAPAGSDLNKESVFYRFWEKAPERRFARFRNLCGARVDAEKGALIVDLPENSEYDSRGMMGAGVFHTSDVWLFAGSLEENAFVRLRTWRKLFGEGHR